MWLALTTASTAGSPQDTVACDLLIRGGRVLDGSGNPWVRADLAIRDGRIVAVGSLGTIDARQVVDARDRYVAPGFIDAHSHAAAGLVRPELRQGRPLLAQGITTILGNPDGGGPIDLIAQRAALETPGIGVNVGLTIGHGAIRRAEVGELDRPASESELARMRTAVRRGMDAGAFGLSSGLAYVPGRFAPTEELVALMREVAPFGGIHTSHIRDEGNATIGLLAAVDEIIRIARETNTTGIVSHMKALGPDNWGLAREAVARIEAARAAGVAVFADQYPYEASATGLSAAIAPGWLLEGGRTAMLARFADRALLPKIRTELAEGIRRRGGAASIVLAHYRPDPSLEGQSLEAIAAARRQDPTDSALALLRHGEASIISFNMSPDDIDWIMRQPWTMTSSDGGLVLPTEGKPHPRNYGAFPRKLARYARDRAVIPFEPAVRSMTSLPALVLGIRDRGVIRPGAWADIVVFDPARIEDPATYTDPHQLARGFDWVIVNGVPAIAEGQFTGALAGRVLARDGGAPIHDSRSARAGVRPVRLAAPRDALSR